MKRLDYKKWTVYLAAVLCVCVIGLSTQAAPMAVEAERTEETAQPAITVTISATPSPSPTTAPTSSAPAYSAADLDLLSRVVYSEAGSDWCSDEMQLLVANVVINRMNDKRFPTTLRSVVYQRGQYQCVASGMIKKNPNARAIQNAKRVLDGERFCPASVVWQSEFMQGKGLWKKVGNQYFCY